MDQVATIIAASFIIFFGGAHLTYCLSLWVSSKVPTEIEE